MIMAIGRKQAAQSSSCAVQSSAARAWCKLKAPFAVPLRVLRAHTAAAVPAKLTCQWLPLVLVHSIHIELGEQLQLSPAPRLSNAFEVHFGVFAMLLAPSRRILDRAA